MEVSAAAAAAAVASKVGAVVADKAVAVVREVGRYYAGSQASVALEVTEAESLGW